MKKFTAILITCLLVLSSSGALLMVTAEETKTVVLDSIDTYTDTTALTDAGFTINPYAASAAATVVSLNTDAANSYEGNSVAVSLGDDKRNPSLQNSFNIMEGALGFEFWFSNPNANAVAIYISFNWGPFIKAESSYFVKDFSKNDADYVQRTTESKQYFNMEFEPGFKGFVRIPFASCNAPVDSLLSTSIQLWSLGEETTGNGNIYYFDNISLYGLDAQAIMPEDQISSIEVTSNLYGFVPRIEGDLYEMDLSAAGYNAMNELRENHQYVWALLETNPGVSLTSAGKLTIDETAVMGELNISCTVKYDANGELGKTLEFKMNLSQGDKLLTSTGATKEPPKKSAKDYFKN